MKILLIEFGLLTLWIVPQTNLQFKIDNRTLINITILSLPTGWQTAGAIHTDAAATRSQTGSGSAIQSYREEVSCCQTYDGGMSNIYFYLQ